jgi:hypothetical protein
MSWEAIFHSFLFNAVPIHLDKMILLGSNRATCAGAAGAQRIYELHTELHFLLHRLARIQ